MKKKMKSRIVKHTGKLGILIPGLNGAVSTTFLTGVLAARKGLGTPIGSLTQMGTIRLGKRTDRRSPLVRDFVPLAPLKDLVFGGWDIRKESCFQSAMKAGVVAPEHITPLKKDLDGITPMKAAFDQYYVKRLSGRHVKKAKTKFDLMEAIRADIREFRKKHKLDRCVMIWCGSTEIFIPVGDVHKTEKKFVQGMKKNHRDISPSMLYAWASVMEGVPFANGAPNLSADVPALVDLAKKTGVAISGKDFKTGQTLLKTVIAPMLKARLLGLHGWFSSNILGNRDGEVLDDPESFKTKEERKLYVLHGILQPEIHPKLYKDFYHKVRINYYPPRGDNKESWDNIDIFGWLGYPMQIKINFLCRDSILAAPIVLDLVLFSDLAQRAGMKGIQEWLSFYYKSPMHAKGLYPQHDLFIQLFKLKNTLRHMKGEDLITHLGLEYYD